MVLQEVLAIAAEGAGTSIQELKESPTFRQCLSRISAQAALLDPLKLSLHLSLSSLSEFQGGAFGIPHRSLDSQVLALLSALGNRLIQSAADCLPDSFDYPKGYEAVPVNLQLPLSKSQLVQLWKRGKLTTREDIAILLAQTFSPRGGPKKSAQADQNDQPNERVLPHFYGKWCIEEFGSRANCVGKALMVAGFGRLAGSDTLAVSPIRCMFTSYAESVRDSAKAVLDWYAAVPDIALNEERKSALERYLEYGTFESSRVSGQHMAVSFPLGDGSWILVDPNMGISSLVPKNWEFTETIQVLRRFLSQAPGTARCLSLTQCGEQEADYAQHASGLISTLAALEPLRKLLLSSAPLELERVLEAIRDTETARAFPFIEDHSIKANDPDLELRALLYTSVKALAYPERPDTVFQLSPSTLRAWVLDLSQETLRTAVESYIFRAATVGLNKIRDLRESEQIFGRLMHPEVQIALPEFAFAFCVLRHIAINMGNDAYNALLAELYGYGFDQFYLWGVLGGPFRGAEYPRWMLEETRELMEQFPARLKTIDILLKLTPRIASAGLLTDAGVLTRDALLPAYGKEG